VFNKATCVHLLGHCKVNTCNIKRNTKIPCFLGLEISVLQTNIHVYVGCMAKNKSKKLLQIVEKIKTIKMEGCLHHILT